VEAWCATEYSIMWLIMLESKAKVSPISTVLGSILLMRQPELMWPMALNVNFGDEK
jgi:hypothetical protein